MLIRTIASLLLIVSSTLLLSACGEEWSVVYTKDVMPYGNQRTAGSGVVYVRKALIPARSLNLTKEADTQTLNKMHEEAKRVVEKTFHDSQSK